jgi:hypothetical protein
VTPLQSPLRRFAAIITVVLFGLIGLAAPAAQAAGDRPEDVVVTGSAQCNPEAHEWTVYWTVSNSYLHDATVHDLKAAPVPVEGLDGFAIPHRTGPKTPGTKTFTQKVRGDQREASVSFTAIGEGINDTDNSDIVPLDDSCQPTEKPCVQPERATFHHTFAVTEKQATAKVTLDDDVKLCEDEPVTLVSYFAPRPQFAVPQYLFDHQTATITNADRTVTLAVTLPACDTQADLFFGGEKSIIDVLNEGGPRYGDLKLGSSSGKGARSAGPQAWFNGGTKGCSQPDVSTLSQCDGTVDVNLSNTGDLSKYAVDFTIKADGFDKTVTVAPGTAETVHVPAGAGRITVTADGLPTKTFEWKRPADCAPPAVTVHNDCFTVTVTVTNPEGVVPATAEVSYGSEKKRLTVASGTAGTVTFKPGTETDVTVSFPGMDLESIHAVLEKVDCTVPPTAGPSPTATGPGTPGGSGGGETGGLPITGAAAGSIAGGAAVLLALGGVLFYLARRRRVRFTA